MINGKTYHKLEIVGKGGSGKVYKVIGEDLKIYALKRVKFNPEDTRAVESYKNEINLLRSLKDKPNIIQMYDCSEDYDTGILFMVSFLKK
jgi:serine/threonine-protein kinase TTK/MPS1